MAGPAAGRQSARASFRGPVTVSQSMVSTGSTSTATSPGRDIPGSHSRWRSRSAHHRRRCARPPPSIRGEMDWGADPGDPRRPLRSPHVGGRCVHHHDRLWKLTARRDASGLPYWVASGGANLTRSSPATAQLAVLDAMALPSHSRVARPRCRWHYRRGIRGLLDAVGRTGGEAAASSGHVRNVPRP